MSLCGDVFFWLDMCIHNFICYTWLCMIWLRILSTYYCMLCAVVLCGCSNEFTCVCACPVCFTVLRRLHVLCMCVWFCQTCCTYVICIAVRLPCGCSYDVIVVVCVVMCVVVLWRSYFILYVVLFDVYVFLHIYMFMLYIGSMCLCNSTTLNVWCGSRMCFNLRQVACVCCLCLCMFVNTHKYSLYVLLYGCVALCGCSMLFLCVCVALLCGSFYILIVWYMLVKVCCVYVVHSFSLFLVVLRGCS